MVGVSRTSLWRWANERGLPIHRLGGVIRFPADKVEAWLQKHTMGDSSLLSQPVSLASGSVGEDERTIKHLLEEQTALLREIRDLLKAKRMLTMALVGQ